jgi:uncharacterized protein YbjT (DUF2867 family)
MKIVVIGGTGLIGSRLVNKLRQLGHEVIAASPSSGVNTITGEGLDETLENAQVVVDVSNSPSFEDKAVMEFFTTSTTNLLKAEKAAGVGHHVALSIVGVERPSDIGYFHAKEAQEKLVKASGIPYSILHSTQFFEFAAGIAKSGEIGSEVHVTTVLFQPIASNDVVNALFDITLGAPLNSTVEVAGPERLGMDEFVGLFLKETDDPRRLVPDKNATYFGAIVNDQTLIPGANPRIGSMKYKDWLHAQHTLA